MKKNYNLLLKGAFLTVIFFSIIYFQGCALIGIFGSETSSEKKVPAQIRLISDKEKDKDKKLLILVNQPSYLNAPPLLGKVLTEQIESRLIANKVLSKSNFIGYDALMQFRSSTPNYYSMSPQEIAKALNADWVMVADLTEFKLVRVADSDYYGGALAGRVFLAETAVYQKLWPDEEESKKITVRFDVEKRGPQAALSRLAAAFAHCTTRYFYDCPYKQFKIAEEISVSELSQFGY